MSKLLIIIYLRPFQAICENCGKEVTTYVKSEYNFFIVLHILILLLIFGFFYGSLLIIITLPLFKNISHYCPICLSLLHENQFYPIAKKENFFMIQYGKCVMVIKAIYIYLLLSGILVFGIILNVRYFLYSGVGQSDPLLLNDVNSNEFINNLYDGKAELTWEELIKDCGASVMVENSARAIEIFNRKYFKKQVEWKGYFLNAFVRRIRPFETNTEDLVNLNIRMIPSESLKSQDLVLSMNHNNYHRFLPILQRLSTGTAIKFKATFESVGDEWKPHHLHLIDIDITSDIIEEDKKVVLFKGIHFDISGHMKLQNEVKEVLINLEEKN